MFMETVSRYLASRYVRFGEGEIWFGDVRCQFNFIPMYAREMVINSELYPNTYAASVFLAARKAGYDYVKSHGIPLVKTWPMVVRMGVEWLGLYGHGSGFRFIRADDKAGLMILVGRCAIGQQVKSDKPSQYPVDVVPAALMAGTMQYYTKTPTYAVEISCIAQKGVNECTFIAGSRKTITDYVGKFAPDQMAWTLTTLDRIEVLEKNLQANNDTSVLF